MKGKPLKTVITAIGKAEERGSLQRGTRDTAVVQRRDNTIWPEQDHGGHCIAWIHFSVTNVPCTIFIMKGHPEEVRRNWHESWREVSGGYKSKGKEKGKGKAK